MLRQIAIFLLVPLLAVQGVIPDDVTPLQLSFVPAQLSSDNNFDPDRTVADIVRTIVVQFIFVIAFAVASFYFIPRFELPEFSLGSRAPPFSR
jgi:predicted lipoprotein